MRCVWRGQMVQPGKCSLDRWHGHGTARTGGGGGLWGQSMYAGPWPGSLRDGAWHDRGMGAWRPHGWSRHSMDGVLEGYKA